MKNANTQQKLSTQTRLSTNQSPDSMKKIGVNGYGRFSLHLLRDYLRNSPHFAFEITWINDPFRSAIEIADELRFDQVLGETAKDVKVIENRLLFPSGHVIRFSQHEDPTHIPWENDVDMVLECTGKFTRKKEASKHLRGRIERVLISATSLDADKMIILGVNDHELDLQEHRILSYGSCTINGFMPFAKVFENAFGITSAGVNVTHNTPLKEIKGSFGTILRRDCTLESVGPHLMPTLVGNFFVQYHLVPYPGVSLMDLQFRLKKNFEISEVLTLLKQAAESTQDIHFTLTPDHTHPEQHIGNRSTTVIIENSFKKIGDTLVFSVWFDNENSAVRLNDLANYIIRKEIEYKLEKTREQTFFARTLSEGARL